MSGRLPTARDRHHQETGRRRRRVPAVALGCAGGLLGAALVLGACGSPSAGSRHQPGSTRPTTSHQPTGSTTTGGTGTGSTGTGSTGTASTGTQATPVTQPGTTVTSTPPAAAVGLENVGLPVIVVPCTLAGVEPYATASAAHPFSVLGGTSAATAVTSGFEVVGGGACPATFSWYLPLGVASWSARIQLGSQDATGSAVSFSVDGKPVAVTAGGTSSTVAGVGPNGTTVTVPLSGAHSFSIVVPGDPSSLDGPESLVFSDEHVVSARPILGPVASGPDAQLTLVYSNGCPGEAAPTYAPDLIPASCADYDIRVQSIQWSSWSDEEAVGTGTLAVNDCTPSCAGGTFSFTPTVVTLSDPVPTLTRGPVFGKLTFRAGDGRTVTFSLAPTSRCPQFFHDC